MIPATLIGKLYSTQHLVILTGAGVSAESGIATFRDALAGLWENYDAASLASEFGFRADPALVWGWYEWRRNKVLRADPNPAHYAIAQLEKQVPKLTLITQNVDDLHERAGSHNVLHLHGSLHNPRCLVCDQLYVFPEQALPENTTDKESRIEPPHCHHCDGPIRPGVVWFGEQLPMNAWESAQEACRHCDLMLVIGTSGVVWPVADLPYLADQNGASIVQINPVVTSLNALATYNLTGKAGEVLPQLYAATFASG
jgi:NAD-dependent deacetylase